MPTDARVREALDEVVDPCSAAMGDGLSVIEMGLLKDCTVDGDEVTVELRLTTPACMMVSYFVDEIDSRVGDLPGVASVTVETDSGLEWTPSMMADAAQADREARLQDLEARFGPDDGPDLHIPETAGEPGEAGRSH